MVVATSRLNQDPMPTPAPSADIMPRLRERTAGIHAATEELPLMRALLAPTADANTYRHYLGALQAVYLAVEPVLYANLSPALLSALGVRPKLPALQQDLAALAIRLDASPGESPALRAPGLSSRIRAAVQGEPAALGGLYVLEGATLGGRVIARRLRQHWGPNCNMPFAFLEFRGANPGSEWRRFGNAINLWCAQHDGDAAGLGDPPLIGDQVIEGAIAVFESMHQAFRDAGPGDKP